MRTDELSSAFLEFFEGEGLRSVEPVGVTSGIDPSVRFVGSTISVLKPHLTSPPAPGLCLAQPALRTQNLGRLLADPAPLLWSSVFQALGTLAPHHLLEWTLDRALTWLSGHVGAPLDRLVLRADSSDRDLLAAVRQAGWSEIELDGYEPFRYRHVYGVDGVTGRNVNMALRHSDGRLRDFANVIVVAADDVPVAVEFAIGTSAFLANREGLDHPLQASPVADVLPTSTDPERRLADAVSAAALLLAEGLRPVSRGRSGILRRYLLAVAALLPNGMSVDAVGEAAGRLADDAGVGKRLARHVAASLSRRHRRLEQGQ
jgi:hypothetical protein